MAITAPAPLVVAIPPLPSDASSPGAAVVWLHGELDLATVTKVAEELARAIGVDDAPLVVDLSGVTFMDGSTVGVIVRVRQFLAEHARELTIRSPSASVRRILDLCDLTDLVGGTDLPDARSA